MKNLKFLQILLLVTLVACTSCEDEDKLPGSKPDMLIGKWECMDTFTSGFGWFGGFTDGYRWTTYEFQINGGSITERLYYIATNEYKEPSTTYFENWSYSEENETIYFENHRGSRWEKFACDLTPDSIYIGCNDKDCVYYKIKE
jgi:hypothetical protein